MKKKKLWVTVGLYAGFCAVVSAVNTLVAIKKAKESGHWNK